MTVLHVKVNTVSTGFDDSKMETGKKEMSFGEYYGVFTQVFVIMSIAGTFIPSKKLKSFKIVRIFSIVYMSILILVLLIFLTSCVHTIICYPNPLITSRRVGTILYLIHSTGGVILVFIMCASNCALDNFLEEWNRHKDPEVEKQLKKQMKRLLIRHGFLVVPITFALCIQYSDFDEFTRLLDEDAILFRYVPTFVFVIFTLFAVLACLSWLTGIMIFFAICEVIQEKMKQFNHYLKKDVKEGFDFKKLDEYR